MRFLLCFYGRRLVGIWPPIGRVTVDSSIPKSCFFIIFGVSAVSSNHNTNLLYKQKLRLLDPYPRKTSDGSGRKKKKFSFFFFWYSGRKKEKLGSFILKPDN